MSDNQSFTNELIDSIKKTNEQMNNDILSLEHKKNYINNFERKNNENKIIVNKLTYSNHFDTILSNAFINKYFG